MAHHIALKGPMKYVVTGVVLASVLGAWVAPSSVSSLVGSAGRSFGLLRGGYVEQHKTNLTGHWLTSAKGRYRTNPFFASAGETVTIDHAIAVGEGRVGVSIRRYVLDVVPERVWSQDVGDSTEGRFTFEAPATGFYCLELQYVGFAGSVTLNWSVADAPASGAV